MRRPVAHGHDWIRAASSIGFGLLAVATTYTSARAQDADGDGFSVARVGSLLLSNGIAFDESSGRAFVTSSYGGITVLDVATGRYLDTFDVSSEVVSPNSVAFADGKLYVGSFRDIAVVDAADGSVMGRIARPFYAGSVESEIVASPDGSHVYAAGGNSTVMVVIDVATDSAEALVSVGPDCNRIALAPDGAVAYLTNKERGLLFAVDIDSRRILNAVPITSKAPILDFPCDVGVASTTGRIYVSWVADDYLTRVTEFDSDLSRLNTIATDRFATGLDVSSDGRFALLGSGQVLDLDTGMFAANLPLPQYGLCSVAFRSGSRHAVVTHGSERAIHIVSGFEPTLVASGSTRLEGRLDFAIDCPIAANAPYQLAASNSTMTGFLACAGILFPLDPDPFFQLTRSGSGAFGSWTGTLDENGRGAASLVLSSDLPIRGAGYPLSVAFATFIERRDREDVDLVSNTVTVWVRP